MLITTITLHYTINITLTQTSSTMATNIMKDIAARGRRHLAEMQNRTCEKEAKRLTDIERRERAYIEYVQPIRDMAISRATLDLETLMKSDEFALSNFHATIKVCRFMYPFFEPVPFIDILKGYGLTIIKDGAVIPCPNCKKIARKVNHTLCWKSDLSNCMCGNVDDCYFMYWEFSVHNIWSIAKQEAEKTTTMGNGGLCGNCVDEWVARHVYE